MKVDIEKVETILKSKYWTIGTLSKITGISYQTLYSNIKGRIGFSVRTAAAIAKALDVTVGELITEE